ncbi:fibromodulin-like [Leucoraja erinacea]|uniref:fibromodulin-like n=1 Tax=Leucoraja erinaceus TaxID=7782 RepID=UPI002456AE25|nr:fibromodulin-like [Leucoraja erinacea]
MNLPPLLLLTALLSGASGQYTYGYFNWLARVLGYSRPRWQPYVEREETAPSSADCPAECTCPPALPTAMYCDTRGLRHVPHVPARMKYVYLQDNLIQAVPDGTFDNATGLLWLVLHRNNISTRGLGKRVFSKLDNLQRLYLDHNKLTSIPHPLPHSLQELRVSGNRISKVQPNDLQGLRKLTTLLLNDNRLEDVGGSLKPLASLSFLDLSHNHLMKVPKVIPGTTQQLYLDYNHIRSIPSQYFRKLLNLQYARISNNQLTDKGIPTGTFNISSLIELDLSHNKLHNIPPVNENLENLYLHANRIKEIKVGSFCAGSGPVTFSKIRVLRLDGNGLGHGSLPEELDRCLRQARVINI